MPADWSSIITGFAIVGGALIAYAVSIGWRTRRLERDRDR